MSFPTVPPSAPERPQPPRRSDRFFAWVAGLGVARTDGWIGGVAAGMASRLRIDPLIVRGILVVAALFGMPLIFLYALAWALLPDPEGRIHLRELLRGRFEPAQLGILIGVVIGLLTVTPTVGLLVVERILNPYSYQTYGVSPFGVFLFIVGLVLVGILLTLIVRAARRTPGSEALRVQAVGPVDRQTTSAPFAPAGLSGIAVDAEPRTQDRAPDAAAAPSPESEAGVPSGSSLIPEPSAPPADAEALESWRAQHAAWQQQDQAWRVQQQDAERVARDQARAERQATAAAFAAEAAEHRRIRRASNPRAGIAYVATTIGVALVAAAAVWLLSSKPDLTTGALAVFSAALVFASGMVIAGVARRRSGFLAFLTAGTLVAGLLTGAAATMGNVRLGDAGLSNIGADDTMRQPFGTTQIYLENAPGLPSHPVVLRKGSGYTEILVGEGVELQLTVTLGDGALAWNRQQFDENGDSTGSMSGAYSGSRQADGSTVYRETITSVTNPATPGSVAGSVVVPVTIDQDAGQVVVIYNALADEEAAR